MLPTTGSNTGTTPGSSSSPTQAITFGCMVLLLNTQTSSSEEFDVTTVGGGSYKGTLHVQFYGPPGSGEIFPDTTVDGAAPTANWHQVPAADSVASAEPVGCIASAS